MDQSATAGSFDLYYGDDPAATGATKVTINVAANATAADVADAINGKGTAPVYATVLKDRPTARSASCSPPARPVTAAASPSTRRASPRR